MELQSIGNGLFLTPPPPPPPFFFPHETHAPQHMYLNKPEEIAPAWKASTMPASRSAQRPKSSALMIRYRRGEVAIPGTRLGQREDRQRNNSENRGREGGGIFSGQKMPWCEKKTIIGATTNNRNNNNNKKKKKKKKSRGGCFSHSPNS